MLGDGAASPAIRGRMAACTPHIPYMACGTGAGVCLRAYSTFASAFIALNARPLRYRSAACTSNLSDMDTKDGDCRLAVGSLRQFDGSARNSVCSCAISFGLIDRCFLASPVLLPGCVWLSLPVRSVLCLSPALCRAA